MAAKPRRFPSPLIKPDVRGLPSFGFRTKVDPSFRPREVGGRFGETDQAERFVGRLVRKLSGPGSAHFVFTTQPLAQPRAGVLLRPSPSPSRASRGATSPAPPSLAQPSPADSSQPARPSAFATVISSPHQTASSENLPTSPSFLARPESVLTPSTTHPPHALGVEVGKLMNRNMPQTTTLARPHLARKSPPSGNLPRHQSASLLPHPSPTP